MNHDSFDKLFNVVFPILFAVALLLAIGGAITAVHFVVRFW